MDHDKRFKRGKLIDLLDSSSQIFLLDYGTNISVENTKLYPLPASVIEDLKPLAFKISLFGVFPTNDVLTNDGEKKKRYGESIFYLKVLHMVTNVYSVILGL